MHPKKMAGNALFEKLGVCLIFCNYDSLSKSLVGENSPPHPPQTVILNASYGGGGEEEGWLLGW